MGLVQGPIDHYWFQVLEKKLPLKTPKMIAIKVVLGELVIGTSSLGIFFTGKSSVLIVIVDKKSGDTTERRHKLNSCSMHAVTEPLTH